MDVPLITYDHACTYRSTRTLTENLNSAYAPLNYFGELHFIISFLPFQTPIGLRLRYIDGSPPRRNDSGCRRPIVFPLPQKGGTTRSCTLLSQVAHEHVHRSLYAKEDTLPPLLLLAKL